MSIADRIRSLLSAISSGPYDKKEKPLESNLANGGHTGYHPIAPKKQRMKPQEMPEDDYAEGYNGYAPDPQVETPPQMTQQPMGPQQAAWGQNWAGRDPSQAAQTPVWGQGWGAQDAPAQGPWGQGWQQDAGAASQAVSGVYPPQQGTSQNASWQDAGMSQAMQASYAQAPVQGTSWQQGVQGQPMGELHYMPNHFVHEDGRAYLHVERLAQPLSASSCFRLIDFMRNGESIVVNTEKIQDERENTHALDILFGAAFTMGYTFTKISSLRIYLISPSNIMVLPYGSIKQITDEEIARRWPGAAPQQAARSQGPQGFDFDRLDRDMSGYTQRKYS